MSYPADHRHLTKEKIVRSARRLFNRRGFDAVSIDDVMADAGLTRGSFYSYFESKGDLYAEAITHILNSTAMELALIRVLSITLLSSSAIIFRLSILRTLKEPVP